MSGGEVDDAYGGYRGMWRDAENEVGRLREERQQITEAYKRRLRSVLEDAAIVMGSEKVEPIRSAAARNGLI